ncbi:MAG: N-acetylglucosamine-6-phosphate deacetylase [Microcoleus vaginatus WJT46-NPBG5]|jgi:N-acetylglucosamine-6-phosphate deacetylase|nr:N-acetylglucosamine-6-phosphate deacetylase [Microcoleus vaginatus WJT46-NPBG5]
MTQATRQLTPTADTGLVNVEIINARLPGYEGLHRLQIDANSIICSIEPMGVSAGTSPQSDVLDAGGDWISLGGVDLQINGALGLAFPDLNAENSHQLPAICQFLWQQGVDGFLPTLVTTSVENFQRSLATLADFMQRNPQDDLPAAKILGVHLEGPFLNFEKRGAHPAEYLLPLTVENVKCLLGEFAGIVKVITLAPELDPTGEVIAYLRSLGITVSLGHSQATVAQAEQAFDLGASMVTHAFNAMPSLHHRQPGLLGAAIVHRGVYCGLIADGEHVSPTMVDLLLRAGGYEKGIFLVSDALAPVGLPDGVYPWDTRQITVNAGTCRLSDGTLAGTTLPLLVGVQNVVKWGICEVEKAILLATEAPRKAIGLPGFSVGLPACLLRWHLDEVTGDVCWRRL